MEPAVLGLVLDSSVLVAAERGKLTTPETLRKVREAAATVTIVICSLTVAELAHGIYRADAPERARMRRQFLDELKAHVPIYPGGGVGRAVTPGGRLPSGPVYWTRARIPRRHELTAVSMLLTISGTPRPAAPAPPAPGLR